MSTQIKNQQEQLLGLEKPSGPFLYTNPNITPTCWIELSRTRFNQNIRSIKNHIGSHIAIAAILKSNAYGHGLVPVALLCQENKFITYIVVFLLSDAILLRQNNITKPILILGGYDTPIQEAFLHNIDVTIYDQETAEIVGSYAQKLKQQISVHIKIDSGLARLGFAPDQAPSIIEQLIKNPYIHIAGIYTHFAESDAQDLTFTQQQYKNFNQLLLTLKEHNISIPYVHLANTAATLRLPQTYGTMIRCGGALYGTYKKQEFYDKAQEKTPGFMLSSFLTLKSRIIAIKNLPTKTPVGYACTHSTTRPTTIAIVSLGYFDGYDRRLSNNSVMLVGDKLAPVLGRIAMNMTTIDITDIPNVHIGSQVTIMGPYTGVQVQDLAYRIGTIDYDLFVGLSPSLPRIICN